MFIAAKLQHNCRATVSLGSNYAMLDTTHYVETPEGIDLQAEVAGPIPRGLAYLIDFAYRAVILVALMVQLGMLGKGGFGIFFIVWFLFEWFYPIIFEVCFEGQTPGKKQMGLMVVNNDLSPISWGTSLLRNLLRAVDFLPFGYLFGLISMVTSSKFQRLGDLTAGSLVIHKKTKLTTENHPECTPNPPPFPLNQDEQMAIISYTQRHQQLTMDRQIELASIINALTQRENETSVVYLRGLGCWLLGKR